MKNGALVLAILAALGCAAAAMLHANPAWLAGLGALACLGVAVAAGASALELRAPDDLREPRRARGPSEPEPLPPDAALPTRAVFGKLWLGVLGAFALIALVPAVVLGRRPRRRGTAWKAGARLVTPEGRPVRADDLAVGGVETVFPEGRVDAAESAVLLLRVNDGDVQLPPQRQGWTPRGNVAYSKICTHAGCPVALYRHATFELYCPCHQSVFAVLLGAKPTGGPAPRPLPQLGLDVDRDGYLIARGDFTEPVGPDEWGRTV